MANVQERLDYERRVGIRQGVIAALAALGLLASGVIQVSGPKTSVNELTLALIYAHKRYPLDLIGALCNAVGLVCLAITLAWLFDAVRARKPDIGLYIRYLAVAGGAVAAIVAVVYAVTIASKANDFVSHGSQTYQEAKQLTGSGPLVALPLIGEAASLLLALGFVLTALGAMRVGLLTKWMGYLGILVGILVLFPIGTPVPVIQAFWLFSFAYLVTGHWPTGVPPAWRSGRAEPWPTSSTMREQRVRAAGARARGNPTSRPAPETVGVPAAAARSSSAATSARPGASKRKRKRRK